MSIADKLPETPVGTKWATHIQERAGTPILALRLVRDPKVSDWSMDFNLVLDGPDTRYVELNSPDAEAEVISAASDALRGYEANKRSRLARSERIDLYRGQFSEFLVD